MNYLPRVFFLSLLFICLWSSSQAQYTFGARWDAPDDNQIAQNQLQELHQMGISILEVSSPVTPGIWETIEELNFTVYARMGIRFPITQTFANPDSSFIRSIEQHAQDYFVHPSVTAIEFFENGAITKEDFFLALAPYISQLKKAGGNELYFSTSVNKPYSSSQFDFYILNVPITLDNITSLSLPDDAAIKGVRYLPSRELKNQLSPLKKFLEKVPSQKTVFFDAEWLFSVSELHQSFKSILYELSTEQDAIFPLPHESLPRGANNSSSLPSLLLLIVWGSIGIHYSSSPLYRKSAFRYFRGHKFFIRDIFHRQMRSITPALAIIIQNAFILSICTLSASYALWSTTGFEALFHYLPELKIFSHGPISIATWVFVGSLLLSFISIFWLYLAHTSIHSLTQVATIYAWPMQINFFLGIIAVALLSSSTNHFFITATTLAAIAIFLLSFLFASLDIYRHLRTKGWLYLMGTGGIYLALLVTAIAFALNSVWWDGILLSLELK